MQRHPPIEDSVVKDMRTIGRLKQKYHLEPEVFFRTVEVMDRSAQKKRDADLRERVANFLMAVMAGSVVLLCLHGLKLIELPQPAIWAISGNVIGGTVGLLGLLVRGMDKKGGGDA